MRTRYKVRLRDRSGLSLLPETTYELSSGGTEGKVRIVLTAGQAKTLRIIKVQTGTYNQGLAPQSKG
jgi:hypothetical protein